MKNLNQRRLAALLVVASLLAASPIFAQAPIDPQGNWASVQAIKLNSEVRVALKNNIVHKGKLQSASETAIVISGGKVSMPIQRADILAISTSRKSIGKSTLIGAAVGASAGVVVGLAAGGCSAGDFICFSRGQSVAVAAPVLAIPGALVGLLIGGGRSSEVLVYSVKP